MKKTIKQIGLAFLAISMAVSCTLQEKIPMATSIGNASLATLFNKDEVIEQLDPPSEIFVSLYNYSDRITITWTPSPNANSYCLERAIATQKNSSGGFDRPDESEYEVIEHTSSLYETSYTDVIIKNGVGDTLDYKNEKYNCAYFYRVIAENRKKGYESSEPKYSTMAAMLAPPSNLKASMGDNENNIKLTWEAAAGASRYEIMRSQNDDGSSAVPISTTSLTTYTDTSAGAHKGKEYYYTVYAVTGGGAKSVSSTVAMGYTLLVGAPPKVSGVEIKKGRGDVEATEGIKIKWNAVPGDINYTIYRTSSSDSRMEKLKENFYELITEYTDTKDLQPNTYYYYYVQATTKSNIDDSVLKGAMSESGPTSKSPAEGFIVSAPTNFAVSRIKGSQNCKISFYSPIGDAKYLGDSGKYNTYNAYTYVIEGSNVQNSSGFSELASLTNSSLTYTNDDKTYSSSSIPYRNYYRIRTCLDGAESLPSDIAAPAPFAAESVYVSRAEMVGDYSSYMIDNSTSMIEPGANRNGVHPVRITWLPPEDGAGGYNIYRSTKFDSGFKKINDSKITSTTYIDSDDNMKAGVIYYYKVLSLNELNQGVNYSDVDQPTLISDAMDSDGKPNPDYIIKTENADGTPFGRGFGWGALTAYQYMREHVKTVNYSHDKLPSLRKGASLGDMMSSSSTTGDIRGLFKYEFNLGNMYATLTYHNYADYYVNNDPSLGIYLLFAEGNTDTKADMSKNGNMYGELTVKGMYPAKVRYDKVVVKGGDAGGGTFGVIRKGIDDVYGNAANQYYQEISYTSAL